MSEARGGLGECVACHRPTRPQGSPPEAYPGATIRMARDLCSRCYALDLRGVDPVEAAKERAAASEGRTSRDNRAWLKIGSPVQLVRWVRTRDGDVARLVDGKYQGCSDSVWRVLVLGEVVEYDRVAWEVTTP